MTIIEDFYVKCTRILIVTTLILIIIRDIEQNLMIIRLNNPIYAETTITTLEVQNYHFASRGNILDLIFKNYYGVVLI